MRRLLLAGLVAGSMIAGAGSALAGPAPSGSHEGDESAPYSCPTQENPEPGGPAYDDDADCTNGASTYTVTEYDNDVTCAEPTAATPLAGVSAGEYFLEVCNDGDTGPIQGRVILSGSAEEGANLAVDGDADNPENGTGWVGAHVGSDGPSVQCGDTNGNLDSQTSTDDDTSDDCDPSSE